MHVCLIGVGIVGLATAKSLRRSGQEFAPVRQAGAFDLAAAHAAPLPGPKVSLKHHFFRCFSHKKLQANDSRLTDCFCMIGWLLGRKVRFQKRDLFGRVLV